jgi:uncharacterized protein (DUF1015 family)
MPTIDPVARALVPADSAAATELGAPNYDEFQSDEEVWSLLQLRPHSVLRVTMPHCHVPTAAEIGDEDDPETLWRATTAMGTLIAEPLTREVRNILWVYEITDPRDPAVRQIGLGGMGRTDEIRTAEHPNGTIIRNEGIRESKAQGRARLTEATRADMGTVNNVVDDASGEFQAALEAHAAVSPPTFETSDETGCIHKVWLVDDADVVARFRALLANEPRAYVADGNHRSAAAAMLGYKHFLTVFFPAKTMRIAPYNRLVNAPDPARAAVMAALNDQFTVEPVEGGEAFQPVTTHDIGMYDGARWWKLVPKPGTFDPNDAAQDIDADIVQRLIFDRVLGISDARDDRLTYVGANRDAQWLQAEVDADRFDYAFTLAPVTMRQFIEVCLQGTLMPPKSTWFVPKIRSGLVMALLG